MTVSKSPTSNLNADSPSILNKIIRQRQARLAELHDNQSDLKLEASARSLVAALQSSESGFILECKQASPSRGLMTDNYQPQEIAKHYQPFACGISVLTEPDFFSGSLDDLTRVSETVYLPVLCKDFVIEIKQLYSARAAGADVILLMLSVISDQFWLQCYEVANILGLDIITEVHNQSELDRAIVLPAKIIGINNRDLHTLKTDLSVTKALVNGIPSDRLIISESGISSHQQLNRLAPLVDGFLIGSSLMQSESVARALRKLIFGEVKICGLTCREDADLVWQLGASFGGLIFTPLSPRYLTVDQAMLVCEAQPMPMIGVFMDQCSEEIADIAKKLALHAVQLHGSETVNDIKQVRGLLEPHCEIWKTISCSEVDQRYPTMLEALELKNNWLSKGVDKVVIDMPKDAAEHSLDYHDFLNDDRVMVAGGLTIDGLFLLQQQAELNSDDNKQAGFDLCSALEKSPGLKDPVKIKDLFTKLQPVTRKVLK